MSELQNEYCPSCGKAKSQTLNITYPANTTATAPTFVEWCNCYVPLAPDWSYGRTLTYGANSFPVPTRDTSGEQVMSAQLTQPSLDDIRALVRDEARKALQDLQEKGQYDDEMTV